MMPPFRSLLLLVALSAAVCASAGTLPPVPAPAELPDLEAAVVEDPGDVLSGLRLASGYRAAGRIAEAGAFVDHLLEGSPEDPGLLVMSGLIREDAGDLAGARLAYDAVLAGGRAGAMEAEVRGRREVVRRAELRAEVAGALAREDAAAQAAPDAATVGVFPFLYEGDDPDWEPLALAIPEMLATDLAVTGRLRVLERLHVQALLDELALGESGRVDESTAARSGRLLGAANIVQGRFRIEGSTRIGVDAAVVAVRTPGLGRVDPLSGENAIERLFTLNVSGAVFDDMPLTSMGGSLTLFTGSTFQNMDPTVTQLTIEHPGTLTGLPSFSALTFATAPTPGVGYYMRVTDIDPLTLPLASEVLLSSPLTGLLLSLLSGGATLLW
jgi:TolB-like protein